MTEISSQYDKRVIESMQLVYGPGFFSPGGEDEVAQIVEGLDLTRRPVLDVGCGLGGPAVTLARDHGANVVGIDVEQSVLDIAKNGSMSWRSSGKLPCSAWSRGRYRFPSRRLAWFTQHR